MEVVIKKVTLKRYREDRHDYEGVIDGKEVFIDPYVGCVWDNDRVETGKFVFEGFFGTDGAFLPGREIVENGS